MLVQNSMAYKPEKTILAVGSREEVAPELLSGRRARQVCSSQSMDREDALGAGRGGLNPVRFVLFPRPHQEIQGPWCYALCSHLV